MPARKMTIMIIGIILTIGFIITACNSNVSDKTVEIQSPDFEKQIQNDSVLVEIDDTFSTPIEEIEKILNKEIRGYVYFGRDTCPFCRCFNYLLFEKCQAKDLQIYKFDTDFWREDALFQDVLDMYDITSIPALIKINNDSSYSKLILDENETDDNNTIIIRQFIDN